MKSLVAIACAAAGIAMPVSALTYADPTLINASAASAGAGLTGGSYTGVGSVIITTASLSAQHLALYCTGALVSTNVVLTAGHCLDNSDEYGARTSITFALPGADESPLTGKFSGNVNTISAPSYDGDALDGGDYSLFTLDEKTSGYSIYGIYAGDPLQTFARVGAGSIGGPEGTGSDLDPGQTENDFRQRVGYNEFEYFGDVLGVSPNILLSDFDDGTPDHDVFCIIGGNCDTGVFGESDSSPGDSGGPSFINGQIVAVTSFGATLTNDCGTVGAIDPYGTQPNCTNSSIGEVAGDTWLLPYKDQIDAYISAAAAVPEPTTWAMFIAGFGAVGAALRRRKVVARAA